MNQQTTGNISADWGCWAQLHLEFGLQLACIFINLIIFSHVSFNSGNAQKEGITHLLFDYRRSSSLGWLLWQLYFWWHRPKTTNPAVKSTAITYLILCKSNRRIRSRTTGASSCSGLTSLSLFVLLGAVLFANIPMMPF